MGHILVVLTCAIGCCLHSLGLYCGEGERAPLSVLFLLCTVSQAVMKMGVKEARLEKVYGHHDR